MREILFRGKRADNNEWSIGKNIILATTYKGMKRTFICPKGEYMEDAQTKANRLILVLPQVEVDPETVGQYTGLTDKNGKKIFEGDIMPVWENGEKYHYKVIYNGDCFMLSMLDSEQGSYPLSVKNSISEIIGNIHDNPELLVKGE